MSVEITKEEEERYAQLQLLALDFAREGNTEELYKMIQHGMSVNLLTHKDDSLLMLASYNGNLETTQMLIAHGADMNRRNQRGQTPLEGVCFKGNLEMVKLLVESGAEVSKNAFIYATMFGNKEVVLYLKKHTNSSFSGTLVNTLGSTLLFISSNLKKILGAQKHKRVEAKRA